MRLKDYPFEKKKPVLKGTDIHASGDFQEFWNLHDIILCNTQDYGCSCRKSV